MTIYTVGATSRDYATPQIMHDDTTTPVNNGDIGEMYDDADFTNAGNAFSRSGVGLTFRPAAGEGHSGVFGAAGQVRLIPGSNSNTFTMSATTAHTHVLEGLEIVSGPNTSNECIRISSSDVTLNMDACLMKMHDSQGASQGDGIYFSSGTGTAVVSNTVWQGFSRSSIHCNNVAITYTETHGTHYNTTASGFCYRTKGNGTWHVSGTLLHAGSATISENASNWTTFDDNICVDQPETDLADVSGTNNTENATFGDTTQDVLFENIGGEDFHSKATSDAINHVRSANHLEDADFEGDTRPSGSNNDAGADEIPVAGGLSIPVAVASYRRRHEMRV